MKLFNNVRILLAEDNAINTFLMVKVLKGWNVDVDVVENGEQAIAKIRENEYNLVIMDTYMPVMDGLEAIKLIRSEIVPNKKDIPIISFSAAIMESDKQIALDAGADDILDKAFDPQLLHDKISRFVNQ
ncbi:MAG: response regulator [Bacteroidia bacterium]